ncbi:hypothetical protein GGS23DRAFT_557844 [Durotheca rogersii]|uniref:uncharacterized protein n=1 Tax=Durotheca rogersii TaxID=419775 RepID=UPI00221EB5D6|nr:uncharacterized protein GGS23DRAFT_557844 [Durotheca rogersii]KAI5865134.1 hypothetical protein GGS23DRAFT_557844 [Durotheca rogersii]
MSLQEHHHSKSSHRRPDMREHHKAHREEERKVELIDLDEHQSRRRRVKLSVTKTSRLGDVAASLKKKFPSGEQQISDGAEIKICHGGAYLDGHDIPEGASLLHYRVLPPGDDGSLRAVCGATIRLRKTQLETISREARAGKTVGSIRSTVAALLQASSAKDKQPAPDANQIVVQAAGGLAPKLLYGSNWEARTVQTSLCRYLKLDVQPKYLVLRGFNETYLWHSPQLDWHGHVDLHALRTWLRREVLALARSSRPHRHSVDSHDIRLIFRGRVVNMFSRIRPGHTVEFEIPRAAEALFLRAEAPLVPLTETCSVCGDGKRVSEMPNRRRITAACAHDATMCKDCVSQWIGSSMDTQSWDQLKCPECPQLLQFENVRALAAQPVFERYDVLAVKAVLARTPDFMWCPRGDCRSGQIYPNGCSQAKCSGCGHLNCVRHHVPWHEGETCEEYDRRVEVHKKNNEASEKHVKEMSKPCPGCSRNVHKYTGCDHITCVCRQEWCWLCFGVYHQAVRGVCDHKPGCQYAENRPINGGHHEGPLIFTTRPVMGFQLENRPINGGHPQPTAPPAAPQVVRGGGRAGQVGNPPAPAAPPPPEVRPAPAAPRHEGPLIFTTRPVMGFQLENSS